MTFQIIMVEITFFLKSRHVGSPVMIQAGVNKKILNECQLPVNEINIQVDLDDGPHTLWLKYCDKQSDNELRQNDELVIDSDIEIENIRINSSMMNYLKNDHGYVVPDWKHHKDVADWFLKTQNKIPDRLDKSSYLNLKGTYYFEFETPIETFLQKHVTLHPAYAHMYNYPLEKYQQLQNKILNMFESKEL